MATAPSMVVTIHEACAIENIDIVKTQFALMGREDALVISITMLQVDTFQHSLFERVQESCRISYRASSDGRA
jgi:hypothetical protein